MYLTPWHIQFDENHLPYQECAQTHTYTHKRIHKVNSQPERLILAADMVMKQLNHGAAPRSNCVCVCVFSVFTATDMS